MAGGAPMRLGLLLGAGDRLRALLPAADLRASHKQREGSLALRALGLAACLAFGHLPHARRLVLRLRQLQF